MGELFKNHVTQQQTRFKQALLKPTFLTPVLLKPTFLKHILLKQKVQRTLRPLLMGLSLTGMVQLAYAADPLNGSVWKSVDDKTNVATALIKFKQHPNGALSASIQKVLVPNDANACSKCVGPYHNKNLVGLTIIQNLQQVATNRYDNGKILDPQSGKTYSFNAKMSADGKTLSGRGYIGISAIGRSQTWYRVS